MLEIMQMFLFLYKSKYRRKLAILTYVLLVYFGTCASITTPASKCNSTLSEKSLPCGGNGVCVNETCVCYDGWQGPQCQFCGGKVRLGTATGTLHDGLGNYSVGVKCSWLIDAPNSSITLHLEEFATECGWDHLYIFDGDSVESPLLAVFSGLMYKDNYKIRKVPEVVAHSGAALIHFFSDDAYNMSGFNMTYRLNACPSILPGKDCSGNGICLDGQCTCNGPWDGPACHLRKCPSDCHSSAAQGRCEHGGCLCAPGYRGADCGQPAAKGYWESVAPKGFVPPGAASHGAVVWKDSLYVVGGESYSRGRMVYTYDLTGEIWETPQSTSPPLPPPLRYGHSTVLYGDKIFLYGGVTGNQGPTGELWAFDISAKTWENITVKLDTACSGSSNSHVLCGPLKCAGHTATIVTTNDGNKKADRMVVIFGHSPHLGYLNTVQEYYFGTREWLIVRTRGYPVKGGYGHTASWDAYSKRVYVYGGVVSESEATQILNRNLYSYDPHTHIFTLLTPSPSARFLHSATFVSPGLLLIFGGNTHNDSSHSFGAKCYSAELLGYDVACDSWHTLPVPTAIEADLARFGHSASVFGGELYVYGGFDGQMLSDILRYTPGSCDSQPTQSTCLRHRPGIKCVWAAGRCINIAEAEMGAGAVFTKCPEVERSAISLSIYQNRESCERMVDCASCVQTTRGCVWCSAPDRAAHCSYTTCRRDNTSSSTSSTSTSTTLDAVTSLDRCAPDPAPACRQLHTCPACNSLLAAGTLTPPPPPPPPSTTSGGGASGAAVAIGAACRWKIEIAKCDAYSVSVGVGVGGLGGSGGSGGNETTGDVSGVGTGGGAVVVVVPCQKVCAEYTSCLNCTQEECIWCQNEGRCVDKNAYTASFPYGQCREWTTVQTKCRSAGTDTERSQCSFYSTCAKCRDDPACGWCDDGSRTGIGQCMPGGYTGPTLHVQSLPSSTCPSERWHFTNCPTCQCNGHALCQANSSTCQECKNLTTGAQCERCVLGYWGSPVNGGRCQPCSCNGQATQCNPDTGKCYCTTKGLAGDHCEKCDVANHYHGDPINGSCYYELTIDYQFTFNLSKREDSHFTQINFKNSPTKADIDADFSITCSEKARMNITIKKGNGRDEVPLYLAHNCSGFRSRFTKYEYNFGSEDNATLTTFYVYVYDFKPPLWIQISFSQYPKLNLQQFFITFSSCFLLLLIAAAILWKIKQRYDMFRRRQRLFVEMEQMASRPFSQVLVEMELRDPGGAAVADGDCVIVGGIQSGGDGGGGKKRKRADAPSPIALEPCSGNRAAVLSLLVRLPTGGQPYTARGQSAGLAIASGLVTLGNPRKLSVDQVVKTTETGKGGKSRKSQSQHPDSCL